MLNIVNKNKREYYISVVLFFTFKRLNPTVTVAEQGVKSVTQNSVSQQSSVQNSSPNNAQKVSNGNSQQATLISQDKVK